MVESLASMTGADVAASTDATGAAAFGGDWELEYQAGQIEARLAVSALAQQEWEGVLSVVSLTSNLTGGKDYEIRSDQNAGQTFSYTSTDGTYTVQNLEVRLKRDAAAADQNLTVSLREGWNDPPLASASIASSSLGTSYAWQNFDIGDVVLDDATTYFIRITSDDTSGKVYVEYDDSAAYAGGDFLDKGTAKSGEDLAFRVLYDNATPTLANLEAGDLALHSSRGLTHKNR